jgi:hypothetical protein
MNTSWQTVSLLNSSYPFSSIKTDEDGNRIAVLNMPNIRAGESAEYTVFYEAVSKQRTIPNLSESEAGMLEDIPHNLTVTYLNNSDTWMTDNSAIRTQAFSLAGNETKVLVIVENFVNWIWNNIDYASHDLPLYPNETLASKKGDCDDQAILLISFSRIVGIPAYLQIGCIYRPDFNNESSFAWNGTIQNIQNRIGWHGWAMVYIPPWGWLPVDLTYSLRSNALSAIKTAAVTSQDTVQYMNIVQTSYVSEAIEYKSFILNNDFHIRTYDEMILKQTLDPLSFIFESLTANTAELLIILGVLVCLAGVLPYAKRKKRKSAVALPA